MPTPRPDTGSSLRIVPVPTARPNEYPPVGADNVTANVSSGSTVVSPNTATATVLTSGVSPPTPAAGVNVTVPDAVLKSAPPAAVNPPVANKPVTEYATDTGLVDARDNDTGNINVRVPETSPNTDTSRTENTTARLATVPTVR